jgi:anti-anti-sigma factor
MSMRIDESAKAGRHVLALSGELTLDTAGRLDSQLARLCVDGASEIELDLRGLRFIDSTGLESILAGRETCARNGTAFHLVAGTGAAYQLFAVTGLLEILPLRDATFD